MVLDVRLYCIYDTCAGHSMPIFEAPNDSAALRQFYLSMQSSDVFVDFVDQMTLWCVGWLNKSTPKITVPDQAESDKRVCPYEVDTASIVERFKANRR